ncbi:CpxP family protein [Vibrio sp. ZSDZ34]|uniref:CpxP family protein n=1 Tax=Vibrio gelatinilyticus TaxID=2893468 RepID=A0A9X2AX68_9VIBR|nr:CpxP family protein [Vibrio gelatinilyticus]MCJ2378115.1 CpxP family protein [Vibrio gelatinilyticus]
MKLAKKVVIAALVLPLTVATASAYAFGGGKGHHKGDFDRCGGLDKKVFRQLDLTSEQQVQLKQMRESSREEMKAQFQSNFESKRAEMQASHQKMQALVLADTFDAQAANELAQEMVAQQAERRVGMLEQRHKMLSILTPEQKVKLQELQAERMDNCLTKMQSRMSK